MTALSTVSCLAGVHGLRAPWIVVAASRLAAVLSPRQQHTEGLRALLSPRRRHATSMTALSTVSCLAGVRGLRAPWIVAAASRLAAVLSPRQQHTEGLRALLSPRLRHATSMTALSTVPCLAGVRGLRAPWIVAAASARARVL